MTDVLHQALRLHFGFDRFLPGQERVVGHLLAGKSAAAVFPTGGGKSLCYQLPALLLPGVTLVVSPLIALMKDQIDGLSRRGIAAARLDSTLSAEEYAATMRQARAGSLRLLYVAPERFQNERFRQAIGQIRVALFAVNEAHCISEWGHNFRPDYLKLVEFARQCRAERLLALTATATPQVLEDVCRAFDIEPECAIRNSCYRPNLTVLTTPVDFPGHESQLLRRLHERPAGPTIIYVTFQRAAEELAARISRDGFDARAYHAGLEDEVRAATQDWFMQSTRGIVVATIAFGMGIDKADIRYVYHFNPPKSLENYSQEIGRAGRDGLPAVCEMLLCPDDLSPLENFARGDTPSRVAVDRLVKEVFDQGPDFDVSYHELSGLCDIRPLVVRTLLTYLELDGFLAGGTPFFSSYRFQPLRSSAEILAEFDGERRQFLKRIFQHARPARTWFHIDLDRVARALDAPRDRVVLALDYLGRARLAQGERQWDPPSLSKGSHPIRPGVAGGVAPCADPGPRAAGDRATWPGGRAGGSIPAARLPCSVGTSAKRGPNRAGTVRDASAMIAPRRHLTASRRRWTNRSTPKPWPCDAPISRCWPSRSSWPAGCAASPRRP